MGDQHKIVSCGECGKQAPAWQMSTASMSNGLVYYLCEQHTPNKSVHPTESGGWVCSKCKTINSQEWSECCFCDTPRIGG